MSNCKRKQEDYKKNFPSMPEKLDFFNIEPTPTVKSNESSSSDEDDHILEPCERKRKGLTKAERVEFFKQEEERLINIELQLASDRKTPESADAFDRLLLAHPNSSKFWIQYMAFHVAATEINKARAIAKKALETIKMIMIQEKINIWIALVSLECTYGTKETFDAVVSEALKFDDSFNMYLSIIQILLDNDKMDEIKKYTRKIHKKYKQDSEMIIKVAKVFYERELFDECKILKNYVLNFITNANSSIYIITILALMEFKYCDVEYGRELFDHLLKTYPNKPHIWSNYADQLEQKKLINEARELLTKAVNEKSLNLKSQKFLKKKFENFENKFSKTIKRTCGNCGGVNTIYEAHLELDD